LYSFAVQKVTDPLKVIEKTKDNSHKILLRCHECGKATQTPYKSYFISLGDCCGMEFVDFCSKACFEKYTKKNKEWNPVE
jgi:hypothetical protein